MDRRDFLKQQASAMAGATVLAASARLGSAAPPKEPGRVKVGLYSITYLGIWYDGKALSLEEVIDRAKKYGYEGVEIDGKRPHGNPSDWPAKRCKELRAMADAQGVPIYSVAANNDFSSPIPEHRQCQIAYVRGLIRMTADLGAKTLRVFLAWPGVSKDKTTGHYTYDHARRLWDSEHELIAEQDAWNLCRDALAECARYAGDSDVTLALQNHRPIIKTHEDVLRMIKEVNSPHLKACLDVPIMPDKSPATIRRAAQETGALQVLSHFGVEAGPGVDEAPSGPAFYWDFMRAMKEIGYTGYIGYELCHPLPVVEGRKVGLEYAEKNARLAAEFMRRVIREVYGKA